MSASWTRRRAVRSVLSAFLGAGLAPLGRTQDVHPGSESGGTKLPERNIVLFNTHTRETVSVVFRHGEQYDEAALAVLKNVLRDYRNGAAHDMDPKLFDQLYELAQAAQVEPHYEIISGFRSPESNNAMSARPGSGVAKNSLHMQGRAIDVRLKGCTCARLRDLALAAKKGGVGYYRSSDFVHIDTGPFRTWIG